MLFYCTEYNIPTSARHLIEMKMYAELAGDCKKLEIKNFSDNIIGTENSVLVSMVKHRLKIFRLGSSQYIGRRRGLSPLKWSMWT